MNALMDSKLDISSLAERARAGDRDAFEQLADSCRKRLLNLVRFRLGPRLRRQLGSDDVLQETYLRAFRSIEQLRPNSADSFFHWVSGIARRVILEHHRKDRHGPVEGQDQDPEAERVSPSRGMRRDERFERLQTALSAMPPDYRFVLRGVMVDKLPLTEIARRMGRTPNAVSLLLLRANRKLRESLGDTQSLGLPAAELDWGDDDGPR